MGQPVVTELFDYGIHNEATDIRAHVAVLAQKLYVFPTISAVRIMKNYPKRSAKQSGVTGWTAEGHTVPVRDIPNLRELSISPDRLEGFTESLSTSEKGKRATDIVTAFLRAGRFPLWFDGELIGDTEMQIKGVDIYVRGKWKIQTKCDYRAGFGAGCSGNVFLQTAERNPLAMH